MIQTKQQKTDEVGKMKSGYSYMIRGPWTAENSNDVDVAISF